MILCWAHSEGKGFDNVFLSSKECAYNRTDQEYYSMNIGILLDTIPSECAGVGGSLEFEIKSDFQLF